MHAVPAVPGLGHQSFLVQAVQQPDRFPQPDPGQRRSGVPVDHVAGCNAQQPEQPLPGAVQMPVGHLERGGDAVVLRRHGQQPGPGLSSQVRHRPGRVPGEHAGQQRDRQRQEPRQPHHLRHAVTVSRRAREPAG